MVGFTDALLASVNPTIYFLSTFRSAYTIISRVCLSA